MTLAAILNSPNTPIELQELPSPTLEPGGVILETIYSEVCGTDVHLLRGQLKGVPYPIIPGHFSVGKVVEVGGEVRDINDQVIKVGSLITFLDVHETCNSCWYCLVAKASTRCPERRVYGVTYSAKEGLLGGWSQLIYLKPGVKILTLPPGLSPKRFIAGGCALPTALHAVDRAQIQIGDSVVVQGCGPVGLSIAVLALMSGAGRVMIIDKFSTRLAVAETFGVDDTILLNPQEPEQHLNYVLERTQGRGADVTIEAAGVPIAVKEGLTMTRDGGRYVVVGHYTNAGEILLNPHLDINRKHIDIRGTWGIDFSHFYRTIQLLNRSHLYDIPWENIISRFYRLNEINQALADVEQGFVLKAVIQPDLA